MPTATPRLGRILNKSIPDQVTAMARSMKTDPARVLAWFSHHSGNATFSQETESLTGAQKEDFIRLETLRCLVNGKPLPSTSRTAAPRVNVTEKFKTLEELTEMVARGYANSMVCFGRGGLGKTRTVTDKLKAMGVDYHEIGGYAAPTSFYNALYTARDKLTLVDDCDAVFKDATGLNILKRVLDSSEVRRVQWLTKARGHLFYRSTD